MRTLLVGIIMLSTFWLLILLGGSLFRTSGNNNLNYIPSEASSIVIIHGHELLRHTIEDVILKTHDNDLVGIILDEISESKDGEIIETGINFNSDVIYYTIEHQGVPYNVMLINLSNKNSFLENIPKLYPNVAVANEGNVGVIVQAGSENQTVNADALYSLAKQVLTINPKGFSEEETEEGNKVIACIHLPKLERNTDVELDIDVRIENSTINLKGDAEWDASTFQNWAYRGLPSNGVHVSSSIIPQFLEDTLRGMFGEAMPDLVSFSLNFIGTEMVESPIFRIVPDLDILLEFASPFSLDSSLVEFEKIADVTELTQSSFRYGGKLFYYHQIDPLTIYLGRRKLPKLEKISSEYLLAANGNLSSLTKVEGTGMMKRLLELLSIYNAGKEFVNSTREFDISIIKSNEGEARVEGNVHFIDGKRPTNELLRFLLKGDLL